LKNLILSICAVAAFSFSFTAKASAKDYVISHQCNLGEVASVVNNIVAKGDGTFIVSAKCVPADCFLSIPDNNVYIVKLIAARTSFIDLRAGSEKASQKVIGKIVASSDSQAGDQAKKLVEQGYCRKIIFDSGWNYL